MHHSVNQLLAIASPPIGAVVDEVSDENATLIDIWYQKNGFYAFESALHVYPLWDVDNVAGFYTWNSQTCDLFTSLSAELQGKKVFASDAFGNQFGMDISTGEIWFVDIDLAEAFKVANSIDSWCERLLSDFETLTGYEIAKDWQTQNRALEPGERLFPKKPFILGGEWSVDNLWAADCFSNIGFRAYLANQLRSVSDGEYVSIDLGGGRKLTGVVTREGGFE